MINNKEKQIDYIIDNLDDDVTWLIGYTNPSQNPTYQLIFHLIRCEYFPHPTNSENSYYKLTFPCNDNMEYNVTFNGYALDLNSFLSNENTLSHLRIVTYDALAITLIRYKQQYEYSCIKNNHAYYKFNNHVICKECSKWFENNSFRFPELKMIRKYSNYNINKFEDLKFIFSNGEEFGKYYSHA